jgi:hypothetical protein
MIFWKFYVWLWKYANPTNVLYFCLQKVRVIYQLPGMARGMTVTVEMSCSTTTMVRLPQGGGLIRIPPR